MKKYVSLLGIILVFSAFTSFSGINEVITAMRTGNVSQMSKYFDITVDIAMPDKSNTYSKSQAEMVLRDFFNTNGVLRFDEIHKSDQYCIGTLVTRSGSYRTTIMMRQKGTDMLLQGIRFEARQ